LLEGTQALGEKTVPQACQKGDHEDHKEEPRSSWTATYFVETPKNKTKTSFAICLVEFLLFCHFGVLQRFN
jgi:hypothetical protein